MKTLLAITLVTIALASSSRAAQPASAKPAMDRRDTPAGEHLPVGAKPIPAPQIGTPPAPVFDVRKYGAKGDGKTYDTTAIQKAIDACAGTGGSVLLSNGKFLSAHLELKGNMTFYVAKDAVLFGSPKREDYPVVVPAEASGTSAFRYCKRSLLYASQADKLRIDGGGVIDGNAQGLRQAGMKRGEGTHSGGRPSILRIFYSKDVAVRNVTLRNPGFWTQVYDHCEGVVIEHLIVRSPNVLNNEDGLDVCDSRNVVIRNNDVESGDDAICLKSHSLTGLENVLIENNQITCHDANAIKFGTATTGPIKNVRILNNTVHHALYGGLCIESVDGSNVSDILVRGLTMKNCAQPIFIRLAFRNAFGGIVEKKYSNAIGSITGVQIENVRITGTHGKTAPSCTITGITRKRLGEITLKNIYLEMPGGVTKQISQPKENDDGYPQSNIFGTIPAYAFFVRHADNVRFENVQTGYLKPDARPWLVATNATVETVNCTDLKLLKPPTPPATPLQPVLRAEAPRRIRC